MPYEPPAQSETRLGEAIEQLTAGVVRCLQNASSLVQGSVNTAATGKVGVGDVAAYGPRVLRVGLENLFDLVAVMSDNVGLLQGKSAALGEAEQVEVSVPVTLPAGRAVKVSASMLRLGLTGPPRSVDCLTLSPTQCQAYGKDTPAVITVTLDSRLLAPGIYTASLCLTAPDGSTVSEVPFDIPVSDLD
jgi:hypothetical protein